MDYDSAYEKCTIGILCSCSHLQRSKIKYGYAYHRQSQAPVRAPEKTNAPSMWMVDGRKGGRNKRSGELLSIGEDGPHEILKPSCQLDVLEEYADQNTSVVDLSTARVYRLQQLINLIITHLLSKICQDCKAPSAFQPYQSRTTDALYLSWPTPMKPVMSLSNTWKPRQYSSGSPGSRNPPGRFRTFWKASKSTTVAQTQRHQP